MSRLRALPVIAAAALTAAAVTACGEEKKEVLSGNIDPEKFPTMLTREVETLISDSGITRYRIISPLWLVYDEAAEPYWSFPNTLRLEKFDDLMRIDATVECDSARYFKDRQLWRLDGNVRIANVLREKFLTEQLFWDQRNRKIYSDSFIHIEKTDRVIEGYGFISDEQMTNYTVHNVAGIFPVSEEATPGGSQPAPADTSARAAATPAAPAPNPAKPTERNSQKAAAPKAEDSGGTGKLQLRKAAPPR
ncbi:MAG: LPS export ABC transporter periplasmic protein LptC [Candidatus Amulumruptor caecigallinarius]|nr:LPS export ABC transporter periplasmic protein LptC [Candidatus Amulumruptor caecigallinarius]MCM1397488.1 LPS export ABC transporter periplasmic protein LptC [Candidatus Amulumruptor caecigallinarius]MCM1454390.1 LPS export ABC transporter periplasmic protein LptC [bacterium]